MKRYFASGEERLWFEPAEIESMMDEQLREGGLYPTGGKFVVSLEVLLEEHLKVRLDRNAELDSTILGLTEFCPPGRTRVLINRELSGSILDDAEASLGTVGRWRATLAHEAAHVILHRCLYDIEPPQRLPFAQGEVKLGRSLQCLKREVSFKRQEGKRSASDWREVQANRGMASLLMPQAIFRVEAKKILPPNLVTEDSDEERRAAITLAKTFETSIQATLIRLRTLGLSAPAAQGRMLLK